MKKILLINLEKLTSINLLILNNFVVNQKGHKNRRIRVLSYQIGIVWIMQSISTRCSGGDSGNAQISDVSGVKTAIILMEFLIDQNEINRAIFND